MSKRELQSSGKPRSGGFANGASELPCQVFLAERKAMFMQKDKKQQILEKIEKHAKIIVPILIIVVVALVVAFVLTRGNKDLAAESIEMESVSTQQTEEETQETVEEIPLVPLVENTDTNIYNLIASYFNAFANGDIETIKSISDYVDDTEIIKIEELSKYIESYPTIKVYTKKGLLDNTYIAYVYYKLTFHNFVDEVPGQQSFYICTREDGSLYLHEGDTDEATLEYMREVSVQDDVVELINQVTVEYNDLMVNNNQLFEYISDLYSEVSKATGEKLASQVTEGIGGEAVSSEEAAAMEEEASSEEAGASEENGDNSQVASSESSTETSSFTAVATVNVNMRNQDNEQAAILASVPGSTQVEVLEQKDNGWSRVRYNGQEGYIKSEYLSAEGQTASGGSTDNSQVIRTAVATKNINMRTEPKETAEKIMTVVGSETVEVLSEANGWAQIRYKNKVGFVKADLIY